MILVRGKISKLIITLASLGFLLLASSCGSNGDISDPEVDPTPNPEIAPTPQQFGTSEFDSVGSIDIDGGNIYIAGNTNGDLAEKNLGETDMFIRKYDASGDIKWTRQFGTPQYDRVESISVNGNSVYMAGETEGTLPGDNVSSGYAFVRKYDASGELEWTRQFGTYEEDGAYSVSADSSGVYVAGYTNGSLTEDATFGGPFIRKYSPSGKVEWTRHLGNSSNGFASSIIVHNSSVYVAGVIDGLVDNDAGSDAFVSKHSTSGETEWVQQFGTAEEDSVFAISADDSGVYVAGDTYRFEDDANDVFVRKYSASGEVVWVKQFGTTKEDFPFSISIGSSGAYVVGVTDGDLSGKNAGEGDAFIRKYSLSGEVEWTQQFGTPETDHPKAVITNNGRTYIVGSTRGNLFGDNAGSADAFITILDQ